MTFRSRCQSSWVRRSQASLGNSDCGFFFHPYFHSFFALICRSPVLLIVALPSSSSAGSCWPAVSRDVALTKHVVMSLGSHVMSTPGPAPEALWLVADAKDRPEPLFGTVCPVVLLLEFTLALVVVLSS